jgi:CubicO group peptidase (beta-lactamase class C family)
MATYGICLSLKSSVHENPLESHTITIMLKRIYTILFLVVSPLIFCRAQQNVAPIDSLLQAYYNRQEFNGTILIAQHGKEIFSRSYGIADVDKHRPLNSLTQFQIASVSKQFTAYAIMQLKATGKLQYDDNVLTYLPTFPYQDITIRHLLTHTSGLPDFWTQIRPKLDTSKSNGNAEMLAYLAEHKLPLQAPPGTKWIYCDIGFDLLATIIERLSGMNYQAFLRKYLFEPASMNDTEALLVTDIRRIKAKNLATGYLRRSNTLKPAHLEPDQSFVFYLGDFYGDGSVISTTGDLKKWDDALSNYKLLPKAIQDEAFRPARTPDGQLIEFRSGTTYGFGWFLRQHPVLGQQIMHSGGQPGFQTWFARFPDKQLCVVICMNVESKKLDEITKGILSYLR